MTERPMHSAQAPFDDLTADRNAHRHKMLWRKMAGRRAAVSLVLIILCGLALSGCGIGDKLADLFRINGNGEAEAQEDTEIRIETRTIVSNSFQIEVDDESNQTPTFVIHDGATQYTMSSSGVARFDLSSGSSESFILEVNDVIIERPGTGGTGSVTIIREN